MSTISGNVKEFKPRATARAKTRPENNDFIATEEN